MNYECYYSITDEKTAKCHTQIWRNQGLMDMCIFMHGGPEALQSLKSDQSAIIASQVSNV
jgi:hypothetical protein